MIQVQLKLRLTGRQERQLQRWLWHLTAVYNWAVRKIEQDAKRGVYWSRYRLEALVARHGRRMGIPQRAIDGTVRTAHSAWERCFLGLGRQPRFKGRRNRLNNIFCPKPIRPPVGRRITFSGLQKVRFHAQDIPAGAIKCGRIVRRASGWYLCLFIDAEPREIAHVAEHEVGLDPGFSSLLTLSTGEKLEHPHELRRTAARLASAQRGGNRRLVARLFERQANQRKDRNHKLSRRLVAENALIAWSADGRVGMSRRFGKSVSSAAHGQLRQMLAYKCRSGGREFIEVPSRHSTMTCSACRARSGPSGFAGLSVRQWRCGCGAEHDRDVNAAINTLLAARGMRVERDREARPKSSRINTTRFNR